MFSITAEAEKNTQKIPKVSIKAKTIEKIVEEIRQFIIICEFPIEFENEAQKISRPLKGFLEWGVF